MFKCCVNHTVHVSYRAHHVNYNDVLHSLVLVCIGTTIRLHMLAPLSRKYKIDISILIPGPFWGESYCVWFPTQKATDADIISIICFVILYCGDAHRPFMWWDNCTQKCQIAGKILGLWCDTGFLGGFCGTTHVCFSFDDLYIVPILLPFYNISVLDISW